MPEKFLAIQDFDLKKGHEIFSLKKGESYTKKDLVKFLEKEGVLNFRLKCTKLKNSLIEFDRDIQESIKSELSEEKVSEEKVSEEKVSEEKVSEEKVSEEKNAAEMMFLVNKQIKQDKKVLFKKDQKIAISELKDFDVAKLVEEGFLTEIKISKETANKE